MEQGHVHTERLRSRPVEVRSLFLLPPPPKNTGIQESGVSPPAISPFPEQVSSLTQKPH